jgi:hypothetical protein
MEGGKMSASAPNRKKIKIRCCECGKKLTVDREPDDPPAAVLMEDLCDECGSGGFSDPVYYDADGKEIERWKKHLQAQ